LISLNAPKFLLEIFLTKFSLYDALLDLKNPGIANILHFFLGKLFTNQIIEGAFLILRKTIKNVKSKIRKNYYDKSFLI
jgi:hypothetical protein